MKRTHLILFFFVTLFSGMAFQARIDSERIKAAEIELERIRAIQMQQGQLISDHYRQCNFNRKYWVK